MKLRDWYIMVHVSIFGLGILAYPFVYPSVAAFGTACGALTTVIGMYHWFIVLREGADNASPTA